MLKKAESLALFLASLRAPDLFIRTYHDTLSNLLSTAKSPTGTPSFPAFHFVRIECPRHFALAEPHINKRSQPNDQAFRSAPFSGAVHGQR